MKLTFGIHPYDPEKPSMGTFRKRIELPKGCGIDFAEKEIEKAMAQMKAIALELYKANTEGREIDSTILI